MSKCDWIWDILPSPSEGGVGLEVEDVCEMRSPCEFNYCFLWWPWGIQRLVTTNLTLWLLMWPIGKCSTLYSAEILALQKDKFHANISGCRCETEFFNHCSQTKNNTNGINYRGEKNPNQTKLFFFFPKKRQKKFTFGCYLYSLGRVPACWLSCNWVPLPYLLCTPKLFS